MEELRDMFIALLLLVVIVVVCCTCNAKHDENLWNNGYCPCGGHYKYEQAVGHRYNTSYIYRCDKCGNLIEIDSYEPEARDETEEERIQRVISYGVSSEEK